MNKKTKLISLALILVILIFAYIFISYKDRNTDAKKFKEEYESLNGTVRDSDGLENRTVSIPEDNPFVYVTDSDIVSMIDNKETFYVYFGSKYCPWCRSVVEEAIKMAKKYNIKKIYYVEIWDNDKEEIMRDKYSVNDDGTLETIYKGSDAYFELLDRLDNVLSDYTLTDKDGNNIDSFSEKRIFAPNYIYIKDGKAIKMTDGTSSLQKGSRDELTEDIIKDEDKLFKEFFQN